MCDIYLKKLKEAKQKKMAVKIVLQIYRALSLSSKQKRPSGFYGRRSISGCAILTQAFYFRFAVIAFRQLFLFLVSLQPLLLHAIPPLSFLSFPITIINVRQFLRLLCIDNTCVCV